MRTLKIKNKKLELKDNLEVIFEKQVTKFGSGAKIDCPKRYLNRKVYVLVRKRH